MASIKIQDKNFTYYIQQQSAALLKNTSTSVKIICLVTFFCYFLSYWDGAVQSISVTPGFFFPPTFWIWTAFTFCFLEIHFWEVCVDIIIVGLCGKLIEPLWGALEMMTFFAIVNFGVAILSALFYLLLYTCSFDEGLLFQVHIHGLAGYVAGVTVAVKQMMPDHVIVKTPIGKMTNRNIPLTAITLSIILWLVGLLEGTNPTMITCGVLVSWIYLRFYQRHTNGSRGDMADNFVFASFFPNVLQPTVAVICNTIYEFMVKLRICRRTVRKFDMAAAPTGVTVTIPGTDPIDMERRRQIALKALSERLSKVEHTPLISKTNTLNKGSSPSHFVQGNILAPPKKSKKSEQSQPTTASTQSSGSSTLINIPSSVESSNPKT